MKKWLRGVIIGESRYFDSWTEYRQVMLSGQFGLIAITTFLLFAVSDIARHNYITLPIFAAGIAAVITSMRLQRKGRHCLGNSVLYISLLIIVYLFNSSESPANGGAIFFIPISIGAFASFDYKHRKLAKMVAGVAAFLFMASTFFDLHILPWREYSKEETLFNMLFYFIAALPASMLSVLMLLRLNHRNAKQLLESNGLLKKANDELDRFVYSTAHDLRAPLASVLGLINVAENAKDEEELKKYFTLMRGRIHSLNGFIGDITDYSRNTKSEITISAINLTELATEIWDSLRYAQNSQNIQFQMDFEPGLTIESDSIRLRVILSNLISNAIRYHDQRKENRYVRLSCKRTEKSFLLEVIDNGQGIAPEFHNKIFQMFFRANDCSSGTGLGLYITQEAIVKLSGRVQLQSAPTVGSTFSVHLPLA